MEHDWESGKLLHDSIKNIKCQWRRNQAASLRVACALLRLKLVSSVACTDRDSERVNASLACEVDNFLRLCIVRNLRSNLVLNAGEHTELTLYSNVILMSILNNLFSKSNILVIRQGRTVYHNRREAHVYTALAKLEAVTVVKVKCYLRMSAAKFLSILYSTLSHILEQCLVGIVARTFRNLQDYRRLQF